MTGTGLFGQNRKMDAPELDGIRLGVALLDRKEWDESRGGDETNRKGGNRSARNGRRRNSNRGFVAIERIDIY